MKPAHRRLLLEIALWIVLLLIAELVVRATGVDWLYVLIVAVVIGYSARSMWEQRRKRSEQQDRPPGA